MSYGFFGQIFRGTNGNIDFARVLGAKAMFVYPTPYIWEAIKHGNVPDPMSFGSGYAAVIIAVVALITGKELGVAKASATHAQTAKPGDVP